MAHGEDFNVSACAPQIFRSFRKLWFPKIPQALKSLCFLKTSSACELLDFPADASRRWTAFVHNHAKAVVACDFFAVATATFQLVYVFVIIEIARVPSRQRHS